MKDSKLNKTINYLEIFIPTFLLILGIIQGLLQTLYRAGIIQADSILGFNYYQGLTLHGVVNAIVLTTFFAVALGNQIISSQLKVRLNSFVNFLSFLLMLVGTLSAAVPILLGEASVLYTFYAPLMAHPSFYIGAVLLVVGSWIAFFNWIAPLNRWRKENKDKKIPLGVLGMFTTFIVWFMCTIPVAVEILFQLLPWALGLVDGVNVLLSRTLFWFFGHALVYFWLFPAYVMLYVLLPRAAGGKLYSDVAGRAVFFLFIVLSIPIGLHHQFAEPSISPNYKLLQSLLTFLVAVPSLMTAFTICASLEYAGVQRGGKGLFGWIFKLPFFEKENYLTPYLICGMLIFIVGGVTGIINASYNMNAVVHNTSFIPGHFHLTIGGLVFLAILAGNLIMMSRIKGVKVKSKLNLLVPYLWMAGLFFMSSGLMIGGIMGEPRRTNMGLTYTNPESELFQPLWLITSSLAVIGGVIMTIAMICYFIEFFKLAFAKSDANSEVDFEFSESYHDEKLPSIFKNFTPWIVAAILLIIISYYYPIKEAMKNSKMDSPTYHYNSPVPAK